MGGRNATRRSTCGIWRLPGHYLPASFSLLMDVKRRWPNCSECLFDSPIDPSLKSSRQFRPAESLCHLGPVHGTRMWLWKQNQLNSRILMNWYYVNAGQQTGPVDEGQLDALRSSGQIEAETLVWREGMANWQPYREARPSGHRVLRLGALPESERRQPPRRPRPRRFAPSAAASFLSITQFNMAMYASARGASRSSCKSWLKEQRSEAD